MTTRTITFGEALRFWVKLGFVSFGGPAGQIAIMHRELVERRAWISEGRFLHALNYCMVLPGPEAQQLATYIGWLMHGVRGGIAAGGLFVLPSLFILIALSWIYVRFGNVPAVAAMLYDVKPAVVAIVLAAAWRIGSRTLRHPLLWVIAALAFLSLFAFGIPFPAVIAAAALIGWIGERISPGIFMAPGHVKAKGTGVKALIDDDTPTPEHAKFTMTRVVTITVVFLAIWAVCLGTLAIVFGTSSDLAQMGWFFTKSALLTFGGAYAVLPYVLQGAVENYGWATAPQMIDGLALGESTPGPLIMVVAFVGFLGAGIAGACVATFFTFLPSFLFILAGGPIVERTRDDLHLTAPLTAISAAVVGVILNLTVYFAWHVLWPAANAASPFSGGFDWASAVIATIAAVALLTKKVEVIPVIAASAVAGLAIRAAGL